MEFLSPDNSADLIEALESDLATLEESAANVDTNGLNSDEWNLLQQQCYKVDDHFQKFHFHVGRQIPHYMQEDHVLGLMERFEKAVDLLVLNGAESPDDIFRKIAHYGAATRKRAQAILRLQKSRIRRGNDYNNPFDIL